MSHFRRMYSWWHGLTFQPALFADLREHSGPKQQAVPPATLATFPSRGPNLERFLLGTISVISLGRPDTSLKSYSQYGWAVVDQAVQYTQQVVFPVQITKPLLYNTGKRVVLEVLQREDVLSLEKRKGWFFFFTCQLKTALWSKLLICCLIHEYSCACRVRLSKVWKGWYLLERYPALKEHSSDF